MNFLTELFSPSETKTVKQHQKQLGQINALESVYTKKTDSELRNTTEVLKKRLAKGESLDALLPDAFAAVREAAKRAIGQRHYDVQLIGGIVLHQGKIAEMRTGEGKTLVATSPLYLNALTEKGAHLVTVNDFLAKFQGQWMGQVFDALGLTTGVIGHEQSYVYTKEFQPSDDETWHHLKPVTRKEAYAADITYGTNNEFGFDYLRDNMVGTLEQLVQRPLHYAIVDEVDSILIDEARTPLIISAPARESTDLYQQFARIVKQLKDEDFTLDEKERSVSLTDSGIKRIEQYLKITNLYDANNVTLIHHAEEALKAEKLFKKDKDYVVKDGEIIIVDEFTGRLMHGRRYSEGLHQAIEAKEGVEVKRESETLATISFQNLFRIYEKLAGMTGTAATESEEFYKIYGLDVAIIPTNKPMIRKDQQDRIYKTEAAKFTAVVEEIKQKNEKGQPVLVGTASIERNELLAKLLKKAGVKHELLNAKNHEREAKIIAQAGRFGAVTIATNIAGRGVDIILGGTKPEEIKKQETEDSGLSVLSSDTRTMADWQKEHDQVVGLGGLAVIGTDRHEARRIDNQLRGRAGRQGDPGESVFYVSMEDDLMRIFGGDRIKGMMDRLGLPEDMPIEHSMISKSIEQAQKKVEGHNFDIRKHLVEYDDVMNKHRESIYRKRHLVLEGKGRNEAGEIVPLNEEVMLLFHEDELPIYEAKVKKYGLELMQQVEQQVFLRVIDQLWVDHLSALEELRTGIGLRGYGQRDPLVEYKHEAYQMYERLVDTIEAQAVDILLKLEVTTPIQQQSGMPAQQIEQSVTPKDTATALKEDKQDSVSVVVREPNAAKNTYSGIQSQAMPKVGRNDLCPCGSGKKFKKCHGK